ncbi:MAG TPA: hypothetical protein ENK12_07135, partial [Gammaproteobacteria bacterium]|nr:hypothetical protein [Gammaproteobacteria bacterium]
HDSTLREMAVLRPRDADALRGITGVGERKLEKFGARFLAAIAEAASIADEATRDMDDAGKVA